MIAFGIVGKMYERSTKNVKIDRDQMGIFLRVGDKAVYRWILDGANVELMRANFTDLRMERVRS